MVLVTRAQSTFGSDDPRFYDDAGQSLLEAHLLDFDGDLYGEAMSVSIHHFLRSEKKFEGIDQLVTQLKTDVDDARRSLGIQ